jgi:hypothetical protein
MHVQLQLWNSAAFIFGCRKMAAENKLLAGIPGWAVGTAERLLLDLLLDGTL